MMLPFCCGITQSFRIWGPSSPIQLDVDFPFLCLTPAFLSSTVWPCSSLAVLLCSPFLLHDLELFSSQTQAAAAPQANHCLNDLLNHQATTP